MSCRLSLLLAGALAGCGPSWEACEIDAADGPSCVEFGSAFQEGANGFDDCTTAGGVEAEGSCADLGYSCAAEGDAGQFLEASACASG